MKLNNLLNEVKAESGVGREGKPVIRYYFGGNPKPLKYEDLPDASKKEVDKLVKKHKDTLMKLGKGKFNTENGMDITLQADGTFLVNSESAGIKNRVLRV